MARLLSLVVLTGLARFAGLVIFAPMARFAILVFFAPMARLDFVVVFPWSARFPVLVVFPKLAHLSRINHRVRCDCIAQFRHGIEGVGILPVDPPVFHPPDKLAGRLRGRDSPVALAVLSVFRRRYGLP